MVFTSFKSGSREFLARVDDLTPIEQDRMFKLISDLEHMDGRFKERLYMASLTGMIIMLAIFIFEGTSGGLLWAPQTIAMTCTLGFYGGSGVWCFLEARDDKRNALDRLELIVFARCHVPCHDFLEVLRNAKLPLSKTLPMLLEKRTAQEE